MNAYLAPEQDRFADVALYDQAELNAAVAAERERCAKLLRDIWDEREASHGNRAGPYHDGWTAALDLAVRRLLRLGAERLSSAGTAPRRS